MVAGNHHKRKVLMLAFHGDRTRLYDAIIADAVTAEVSSLKGQRRIRIGAMLATDLVLLETKAS